MAFIEWDSSAIREGTWPLTKIIWSIILARSRVGIFERVLFQDKRRNLTVHERFLSILWPGVLIAFFERDLFHNMKMNLTVAERFTVNFIGT
jgi:hypothetical protein